MSFFDSTKNRVLAGILVGVLIFSVAFGQLGGNSFMKGDLTNGQTTADSTEDDGGSLVEGTSPETQTTSECANIDNTLALDLITSLNQLSDELNSKEHFAGDNELTAIKALGNGIFTILASIDENDCLTDLNEVNFEEYLGDGVSKIDMDSLPKVIELLNDAISTINASCKNCELKILNSITIDIEDLLAKTEDKKECSALKFYEDLLLAHNHLEDVLVGEKKLQKVVLKELLKDIEITSVDLDNLDFERDVEKLSKEIVEKIERLSTVDSKECQGAVMKIPEVIILRKAASTVSSNEADAVEKLMNGVGERTDGKATTPSSQADCPANSVFDDDENECFCPIVDDYIDTDEVCSKVESSADPVKKEVAKTIEEDEEEDPFLFCPDGSLTFDLETCKSSDDDDTEVDVDEGKDEDIILDLDEEEDWENLFASAEDPVDREQGLGLDSSSISNENTSTLLSNTHASILEAETVQGSTGAGIVLLIILGISSVGLAVLNYRKW